MRGEPVLAHSRMRAGRKQVVLEPRFDHPPADEALEADEARYANEVPGHGDGDATTGNEVGSREDEGETDEPPPETMGPLHIVDLLELIQVHVGVQHLELGRGAVLLELGFPVLLGEGWQRAGDGLPFRDAEASGGRRRPSQLVILGKDAIMSCLVSSHPNLFLRWHAYPDSVRRVKPPNTTIPKTLAALPRSQYATDLELVVSGNARFHAWPAERAAVLITA